MLGKKVRYLKVLAGGHALTDKTMYMRTVNEPAIISTVKTTSFSAVSGDLIGQVMGLQCNYDGIGTVPSSLASFVFKIQAGATLAPNCMIETLFTNIEDLGATLTNAHIIFGVRMQGILAGGGYERFCPFSLNTSNRAITALFDIASAPSIGLSFEAGEGTAQGYVPLFVDSGGTVSYIRIYSAVG